MGLFTKSPLQQIIDGSHSTRQRNEYAKQQSVAFLIDTTGDAHKHNAEQLYDKFLEHQSKNAENLTHTESQTTTSKHIP